jgi:hypothetical protein
MASPKGTHSFLVNTQSQAAQTASQQNDPSAQSDRVITASAMEDAGVITPKDAQPTVPVVFELVCYQLKVPVGTVSRNEEFWKRIDEQCLDPARYDLVRRNGIRIGEASVSEFNHIRNLLDQNPGTGRTMGTLAPDAKNIELEMKKDIPFETVNYYDDNNQLCGRSFDASENVLNLSYQRTPRKIGDMRLALTPMVRSLRKHMEFTAMNQEEEITYTAPEKFYLSLIVDLPMDKFLVVAPSDNADVPTILGHQFFVKDDPSEQMEQVLIFVAQPYRLEEQTTASK